MLTPSLPAGAVGVRRSLGLLTILVFPQPPSASMVLTKPVQLCPLWLPTLGQSRAAPSGVNPHPPAKVCLWFRDASSAATSEHAGDAGLFFPGVKIAASFAASRKGTGRNIAQGRTASREGVVQK